MDEGAQRRATASFETADDLLWQAVAGRLPKLGAITLARSGRIGPLVELAMATTALPDAYRGVVVEAPVFHQVERALRDGSISGAGARDRAGVFPLSRVNPGGGDAERLAWEQWAKHAENAAVAAGLIKGLVGGLMGALGELQDNVFEHSGHRKAALSYMPRTTAPSSSWSLTLGEVCSRACARILNSRFFQIPERRCGSPLRTGRRGTRATQATATVSDSCFGHSLMTPPS